jgi:hypothetical protein
MLRQPSLALHDPFRNLALGHALACHRIAISPLLKRFLHHYLPLGAVVGHVRVFSTRTSKAEPCEVREVAGRPPGLPLRPLQNQPGFSGSLILLCNFLHSVKPWSVSYRCFVWPFFHCVKPSGQWANTRARDRVRFPVRPPNPRCSLDRACSRRSTLHQFRYGLLLVQPVELTKDLRRASEIPSSANQDLHGYRHANEQIVWMLKGKMEFGLGTEQRVCGPATSWSIREVRRSTRLGSTKTPR